METGIRNALRYTRWGVATFLAQSIIGAGGTFMTRFVSFFYFLFLFFCIAPLILAVVTYLKLVKPLRENRIPSKKWSIPLTILGLIFGLGIGGILLSVAGGEGMVEE